MTTTRLTLISHGLTLAQKRGRFASDDPLIQPPDTLPTCVGQLLCAPERRARESAALLGEPQVCEALRDVDCGRWQGLALSELAETEPQALAQWLADPEFRSHGGESVSEAVARAGAWMDALGPGAFTAVSHPAVIRAAVLHALGAEVKLFNRLDIAPWASVRLVRRGRWSVQLVG